MLQHTCMDIPCFQRVTVRVHTNRLESPKKHHPHYPCQLSGLNCSSIFRCWGQSKTLFLRSSTFFHIVHRATCTWKLAVSRRKRWRHREMFSPSFAADSAQISSFHPSQKAFEPPSGDWNCWWLTSLKSTLSWCQPSRDHAKCLRLKTPKSYISFGQHSMVPSVTPTTAIGCGW